MATSTKSNGPPAKKPFAPNRTLFCGNLPTDARVEVLRRCLLMLFEVYGPVLDVVVNKTNPKMRGKAHVVFRDIESCSQAMRDLQGSDFFGRPIKLEYAQGRSSVISKFEGTYYKAPTKEPEVAAPAGFSSMQNSVFGARAPAPSAPTPAVAPTAPAAPGTQTQEVDKGNKRPREESDNEEDDDDAAMDVSDSD